MIPGEELTSNSIPVPLHRVMPQEPAPGIVPAAEVVPVVSVERVETIYSAVSVEAEWHGDLRTSDSDIGVHCAAADGVHCGYWGVADVVISGNVGIAAIAEVVVIHEHRHRIHCVIHHLDHDHPNYWIRGGNVTVPAVYGVAAVSPQCALCTDTAIPESP